MRVTGGCGAAMITVAVTSLLMKSTTYKTSTVVVRSAMINIQCKNGSDWTIPYSRLTLQKHATEKILNKF